MKFRKARHVPVKYSVFTPIIDLSKLNVQYCSLGIVLQCARTKHCKQWNNL